MRKPLAVLLICSITSVPALGGVGTSSGSSPVAAIQDDQGQISFTPEQLENLLAPIALYPDPLLAQVLLAATFPDQIDEAARTLRAYNNRYDADSTDWDVSVKAVAHYPTVLSMMADKIDWTTSVGQAYVNQSTDVMEAIQRLRREARSMGNLVTTPQEEVAETDGYIYVYPAQPQYIYVPTYDPAIVYFRRPASFEGSVILFSAGFVIGAWLNHDCDWNHHRVFYHGWEQQGPAWEERSRPYVRVNNTYVDRRYENVNINRTVNDHRVNYGALDRYKAIHRDVDYSNVRRQGGSAGERRPPAIPVQPHPDNQNIRRNFDPNDPRIDANRGHGGLPQTPPEARREVPHPEVRTPQTPPPPPQRQVYVPPQPRVTNQPLPPPPPQRQVYVPPQPRVTPPPPPPPPPQRQVYVPPRPPNSAFGGNAGPIDTRDASRRGQDSRQQAYQPAYQPAPSPRAAPQPRAPNPPPSQPHGRPR
jgi:Protein of unknown function (DUF3300)